MMNFTLRFVWLGLLLLAESTHAAPQIISIVGNGKTGTPTNNSRSLATSLGNPSHILYHSGHRFLYIPDPTHQQVRYVDFDSQNDFIELQSVIGDLTLSRPEAIAFDADNHVYVADSGLQVIAKFNRTGTGRQFSWENPKIVAGLLNQAGYTADDEEALHSKLNAPSDLLLLPSDCNSDSIPCEIVFVDKNNHRIRRVYTDAAGKSRIIDVVGTGTGGYNPAHENHLAVDSDLKSPSSFLLKDKDLYITDSGNGRIRKVTGFLDASGKITTTGTVATLAGTTAITPPNADEKLDISATNIKLSQPMSMAFYGDELYFSDAGLNLIFKLRHNYHLKSSVKGPDPDPDVLEVNGGMLAAGAISGQAQTFTLTWKNKTGVAQVGKVLTLSASTGTLDKTTATTDSNGQVAFIFTPTGLTPSTIRAVGSAGAPALSLALETELAIVAGKVTPADNTVAGVYSGESVLSGYSGDGGLATEALLDAPSQLFLNKNDGTAGSFPQLYVVDANNHRIRAIQLQTPNISLIQTGTAAIEVNEARPFTLTWNGGSTETIDIYGTFGTASPNLLNVSTSANFTVQSADEGQGLLTARRYTSPTQSKYQIQQKIIYFRQPHKLILNGTLDKTALNLTQESLKLDGDFTAALNVKNGVTVTYQNAAKDSTWLLNFAAPDDALLQIGKYVLASRYPFQNAGISGIQISGTGVACADTLIGDFEIFDLEYNADKSQVIKFAVEFTQYCGSVNNPALTGTVHFNSKLSNGHSQSIVVKKLGAGKGTVTPLTCEMTMCSKTEALGTVLNLTAVVDTLTQSRFEGWGGDCASAGKNTAVSVTLNRAKTCTARFELPPQSIAVQKLDNGTGIVEAAADGNGDGINCGTDCQGRFFVGTQVTLKATPDTDSVFKGWEGDCAGTSGATKVVTIQAGGALPACQARFAKENLPAYKLTVSQQSQSQGSGILNAPIGMGQVINCGNQCSETYATGSNVPLTATPATGSHFSGWSGDCQGQNPTTQVTMNAHRNCVAHFDLYQLVISQTGTGNLTHSPAGVACTFNNVAGFCFATDTQVTLTATPPVGSELWTWGGDCIGVGKTATVKLTGDKSCVAHFEQFRPVDLLGPIQTIAGNGSAGYAGDNGLAVNAQLNFPNALVLGNNGDIFIADSLNNRIRRYDNRGILTTFAGVGMADYAGDGLAAVNAKLNNPTGLAIDGYGQLYIADSGNHVIRRIDNNGIIHTFAGSNEAGYKGDGDVASKAFLNLPMDVAVDSQNNVYIADSRNDRIRRVDASSKIITTVAGIGVEGFSGDGGLAVKAHLAFPTGLAINRKDNSFYIADSLNHRIRKVSNGLIITAAGSGATGIGNGSYGGDEGDAVNALLNTPRKISLNSAGELYIADTGNHRIRKLTPANRILTLVGTGIAGFSGDGITILNAQLNEPQAVSVDLVGNLYLVDSNNQRIRRITTTEQILTITQSGGGRGKVTAPKGVSNGIDCGSVCTEYYNTHDAIVLTATADTGSYFSGWRGDCSGTARITNVKLDGLKTCLAVFEAGAPLPACSPTGVINGSCNAEGVVLNNATISSGTLLQHLNLSGSVINNGIISNAVINSGGQVTGGILTGVIENHGHLTGVTLDDARVNGGTLSGKITVKTGKISHVLLAANTQVTGGTLSGAIQGDNKTPAFLNQVKIEDNSSLAHVIIGSGVIFGYNIEFNQGVKFSDATVLPLGQDISAVFDEIKGQTCTLRHYQPLTPKLNTNVYYAESASVDLLHDINVLPQMQTNRWQLQQDPYRGHLGLVVGDAYVAVQPSTVYRSTRSANTLSVTSQQTVYFSTAENITIKANPALQDLCGLYSLLKTMDLIDWRIETGGQLHLNVSPIHWLSGRPDWVSQPTQHKLGIDSQPAALLSNVSHYYYVFQDDLILRKQLLLPAPADDTNLNQAVIGLNYGAAGWVQFSFNSQYYQGVFDYVVIRGDALRDLRLQMTGVGDKNDDGVLDYRVTFQNGDKQLFYSVP